MPYVKNIMQEEAMRVLFGVVSLFITIVGIAFLVPALQGPYPFNLIVAAFPALMVLFGISVLRLLR